jgi:hypothetical protein
MTASDPFAGDPFLEAFDRLPDSQLLKEQHVSALTQISPTWFQKRRAEGRTPPVWVAPTPDLIRYPVSVARLVGRSPYGNGSAHRYHGS